jgi:glycosyltransferase involved in cell wall biosynthesis
LGVPMIFDFDDSIWLQDVSDANRLLGWLKNPAKTSKIISLCHTVIAGNQYLCDYASPHNSNTLIIPTTIDTQQYIKKPRSAEYANSVVTIGWSGSITTLKHFKTSVDVLKTLKKKYGNMISIKVIGDGDYAHQELGIAGQWWRAETELEDLSEFDIGIMPLPDDLWSRGKCGLKGLQYMALEIPTVMSPVGVNSDIIQDGTNGFLASGHDQWVEKISLLVESSQLRQKLGAAGRQTVIDHYSVEANKKKWLSAFENVIHGTP